MTNKILFTSLLILCSTSLFSLHKNQIGKLYLTPHINQDTLPLPESDTLHNRLYPQYKATYLDLLKKVFNTIQKDEEGNTIAINTNPIRNIFSLYPKTSFKDTFTISDIKKLIIKSSNKPLIVLVYQADFLSGNHPLNAIAGGLTIMAVFDPHSGRLLDVVDIASDRFTELAKVNSSYNLPLSSRQEAVVSLNMHHNSSQGYNDYSILTVVDNRIKKIFNFFILNFSNSCEIFEAYPNFMFSKGGAKLFGDVKITIKGKTIKNEEEGCNGKKSTVFKNYKAHLMWNSNKRVYEDKLKEFDALEKQNNANF